MSNKIKLEWEKEFRRLTCKSMTSDINILLILIKISKIYQLYHRNN